ncbi:MAG TPA: signal recognition particle-docking protein FtsY, partial [Terriglobia bacterium]|nr:signal recognition particle-docking protein FtsY [Terriglobia bacterium]
MGFFNLFGNKKDKTETTEPGVFEKIKQAVRQTQENFTERMQDLVVGRKEIDPEMLEELEAI